MDNREENTVPGVEPNSGFQSLYSYNRSVIRNVTFITLVLVYQIFFGDYILRQCGLYMEDLKGVPRNALLGCFLFLIFILDFAVFAIKFKSVKQAFFQSPELFSQASGFISRAQKAVLMLSAFFTIMTGMFFQLMITNSTGSNILGGTMILLVFAKWIFVLVKVNSLTSWKAGVSKKPEKTNPLSVRSEIASDILLTVTSSVIYTVIWEQMCARGAGTGILLFFSIPLFLPTRLIFILQDFYSPFAASHKRRAFLSGMAAMLIPMVSGLAFAPAQISYAPQFVLDDFSAADALIPYLTGKTTHFLFCKTGNISPAEADSVAAGLIKDGFFRESNHESAALKKDSIGYILTITLADNSAKGNAKALAPFIKLRNDLQELFPDKKVRIFLCGYNDGSNIIERLEGQN